MRPTKYKWDPHDLVGPMWILTNKKECFRKFVLEGVLLAFFLLELLLELFRFRFKLLWIVRIVIEVLLILFLGLGFDHQFLYVDMS